MPDNPLYKQIADLVARGLDFPEVAGRLGCDSKTVSNVIRNHYPQLRQDPGRDDDIRREYRAGKTQRELAEKYGLSSSQVGSICRAQEHQI
jgi:DNA-binding CsgD family transcriptional regulator